jgi:hypothetical protein
MTPVPWSSLASGTLGDISLPARDQSLTRPALISAPELVASLVDAETVRRREWDREVDTAVSPGAG